MSTFPRFGSLALALCLFAGCARAPQPHSGAVQTASSAGGLPASVDALATHAPGARSVFAALPDRGELLAYPAQAVRHDGAYTWHRANISEAHALHAVADGHLRLTAPSGALLDIQYDSHVEHPSGDWTWVGHLPGHPEQQTILTFGEHAAFGSIAQPDGPPLRLTTRGGASWLVETDPRRIAMINNAATHPTRPDFKVPARHPTGGPVPAAESAMAMASAPATAGATATPTTVVDVVIGYTAAFAADNGGASGALTHLNFLVDVTNQAYANSAISAKVRLVHAMQVSYPDATSNETALEKLSGSDGSGAITPDPAFNALRAARETYGADLVSFVRKYSDPENAGCGIAWLIGGGQSGISQGDSAFGYSVVSDGTDTGTDGKSYYCLDETLAHELGHNMGAAHDVETSKGDDGVLDASEYGAYPYSFGYKTTATTGNFYTVMAYGDTGQTLYRIFSDPRSTFCGGHACGTTTQADNARTLTQTIPTVANFRATVAATSDELAADLDDVGDFNGDGKSDLLWHSSTDGRGTIWRSANSATTQAVARVAQLQWTVAATGDFDGDGRSDMLWRNGSDGRNVIWKGGDSTNTIAVSTAGLAWKVVGTGDFNGDGKDDIVWRDAANGHNAIWRSGSSATQQTVTTVTGTWQIAGIGDFNADGKSDLLWRNTADGRNVIWKSASSTSTLAVTAVSRSWSVLGVGDFDGDHRGDILWRNTADGRNVIWKSGSSTTQQAVASIALSWNLGCIGDFDGDGRSDIVWRQRAGGSNVLWRSAATAQTLAPVAAASWTIVP